MSTLGMNKTADPTSCQPASTASVVVGLSFLVASEVLAALLAWHGGQWSWNTFILVGSVGVIAALLASLLAAFVPSLVRRLIGRSFRFPFWAFEGFAERVNGKAVANRRWFFDAESSSRESRFCPAVMFTHRETPARLDVEIETGDTTEEYTRLNLDLPRPTPFRCRIYPLGGADRLSRFLGTQENVQLGWEVFDKQFVVKTNDPALARTVLTRTVQQELLNLKLWRRPALRNRNTTYPELTIVDNRLRVRIVLLSRAENLMQFYESCGRIYEEITQAI